MKAPNMATITESIERSLQNCSLDDHQRRRSNVNEGEGIGRSSSSDADDNNNLRNGDAILELNSHVSLPYHWEQCLDLKTGEIYYINWSNGMKAKEDPRTTAESSGDFYYSEEEDDDSSYDSEESSSVSSPALSSKEHPHRSAKNNNNNSNNVLVVAGCKSCLMYFMVPKQVEDCPKCNGQLLHFDRSENGFP